MKAIWRGIKLLVHCIWEGHFRIAFSPGKHGWRRCCAVCDWGIQ